MADAGGSQNETLIITETASIADDGTLALETIDMSHGDSTYTLKNRRGSAQTFILQYTGY
ncbi:MAG: hypothetical protein HY591_00340 [Candidatus Omnitrophica bacterium]|nr:hypothetical protein [Candidatus Omnitrophota bacterium]